jgi:uncharacterized membrane protein YhaH (DUF805 family)
MFDALKKYAVFRGRATRTELWLFEVLFLLLSIVAAGLDGMASGYGVGFAAGGATFGWFTTMLLLALMIPHAAVCVRRLHDVNKSGWWLLIFFVPVANLVLLIFFLWPGTVGPNQFGESPLVEDE